MNIETHRHIDDFLATAEGWCTFEKAERMAALILESGPSPILLCVEVGVFAGGSLIPQALALKERDRGVIIGVDPWKKEPALEGENEANQKWWASVDLEAMHRLAAQAVWKYDLERHALLLRARSEIAAVALRGVQIDILNIDGNHSEECSTRDVASWLPMVRSGGFVWIDDVDWITTQKAVAMIEEECTLVSDFQGYRLYKKNMIPTQLDTRFKHNNG